MSLAIVDFWKLVAQSAVLTPAEVQRWQTAFAGIKGAASRANVRTLAEWLVAERALSRYQATLLMAGQPGPFWYGEYKVLERLESGPSAGAFRAVHGPTECGVELHFFGANDTSNPSRWSLVAGQAQMACRESHPNLRRCFELVDLGRFKFLVAEEAAGRTLGEAIGGKPVALAQAIRWAWQMAQGVGSWQQTGQPHGALSPRAVLIDDAGQARVTPPVLTPTNSETPGGDEAFRADYLPPEMFIQSAAASLQSDVYSLGSVLFETLTGHPPFPGGTWQQKAARHANEPIPPLDTRGVPASVAQLVGYMLAKNPAARYRSMAQVVEAITPFVDAASRTAAPRSPTTQQSALTQHLASRPPASPPSNAPSGPPPTPPTPVVRVVSRPPADDAFQLTPQASSLKPQVSSLKPQASSRYRRRSNSMGVALAITGVVALVGGVVVAMSLNRPAPIPSTADATNDAKSTQPPNSAVSPSTVTPTPSAEVKTPPDIASAAADTTTPRVPDATNPAEISPGEKAVTEPPPNKPATNDKIPAKTPTVSAAKDATANAEEIVADDGKLLWASPTTGSPIDLRFVGLGVQGVLVVRPSALLAHPQGESVVKSLGPSGESFRAAVEAACGVKLEQMEQLVVALYPQDGAPPRPSYMVRLKTAIPEAELAKNWPGASPGKFKEAKIYSSESLAYFIPPAEKGQIFAVGSAETIQEIIEQEGRQPPLGAQLDRWVGSSDHDRHVTFLFAPQFFFGDGKKLFGGPAEKLREPLSAFIGEGVRASLVSGHLAGDNLFLEWRVLGNIEARPGEIAAALRERLTKLPDKIEDYLSEVNVSKFSKKLLNRFPGMLRELATYTRSAAVEDQTVLRCYLPSLAAPNLARAMELALYEGGGATASPATTVAAAGNTGLAGKLQDSITLSFPRDTLEKAIEMWAAEAGVKAEILGGDLQLDGITKNQSFGLDEKNQPADVVLRVILKKASPDGKLIYVIKPEQPGGPEIIQITTIAQATKRGDKIPAGLGPAGKTKEKTKPKPAKK